MHGQSFYNAEIEFTSGDSKVGYAKVPNGNSKTIVFKNNLEGAPTKIKSDELFTITFKLGDGTTYVLERNAIKMNMTKRNGELYTRISKKKAWLLKNLAHNKLNFYTAGQNYKITNDGDFKISSSGQVGFTGIGYYLRRPEEKEVTYITAKMSGIQVAHEKLFRNAASTYFKDNKTLSQRIKNDEFKSFELVDIYHIYISN